MLNIRINGQGLELYYSKYGIPFLTIPSAIAGIVSVVILAHYIRPKLIQYFGQNTLVYFAWHHTIMIPIVRAVLSTLGVCTGYLTYDEHNKMLFIGERLLEFLIIIVILTIINIIISNTKLKFMIGR